MSQTPRQELQTLASKIKALIVPRAQNPLVNYETTFDRERGSGYWSTVAVSVHPTRLWIEVQVHFSRPAQRLTLAQAQAYLHALQEGEVLPPDEVNTQPGWKLSNAARAAWRRVADDATAQIQLYTERLRRAEGFLNSPAADSATP